VVEEMGDDAGRSRSGTLLTDMAYDAGEGDDAADE
jgi:hypothetical protein